MRGLLCKSWQEVWLPTLLFAAGQLLVNLLLTYLLPQIQGGLTEIFDEMPFVETMLSALLGTELGDQVSARTMQAFLWVHPVVLSLIWAHETTVCTRFPAGEVDRGTIDVLLGLPVSRRCVYACESLVWLFTGLIILGAGFLGHRWAVPAMPVEMRPPLDRAAWVLANLFCVYLAVGGIAWLVSTLSDRRGRAIAVIFAVLVVSYLLNFLAQFWEPAQAFAWLSFMDYYQPARVLQEGTPPVDDMVVLLALAGTTWVAGGEVVARRSITTV